MTHALFLFSLGLLEIGESGDAAVGSGGGGGVRGCLVFNYKEWVIQKGVVESEKTERKKKGYGKNESSPKFVNVIPSENNPSLRRASNFYYRP